MKRGRQVEFLAPSRFAFRTPLLPLTAFTEWADDVAGCRAAIAERLADPIVADAIFVASPDLHASLQAWKDEPDSPRGQRVERSLVRYLSRMASRPTPFGLFAAVSVGRFGSRDQPTAMELPLATEYTRSTRIDNDYLFALCEAVRADPALRERLEFRPNSSLYRAASQFRYAEARLDGRVRSHHLVAVEPTPYLERTLERAQGGARLDSLARGLIADDPEIAMDEALDYLAELVDGQILVSDLAPNVTGLEPIHGTLSRLREAGWTEVSDPLSDAQTAIEAIDRGGLGADSSAYRAIADGLAALPTPVELGRLFQVDTAASPRSATMHPRVLSELERAIATLVRLTPRVAESPLSAFRDAFEQRYESREVPLAIALDDEVGVGFDTAGGPGAEASPLIAGLPFPGRPAQRQVPWTQRDAHLLALFSAALGNRVHELELVAADVDAMAAAEAARLPDAFSIMATVVASSANAIDRGEFRIVASAAGGPSGARVLGRFCYASAEHHELVREHLRAEEALRPDALFAEIAHLPEGRIGNILCRPVLRDHEIPFLGLSGAPADKQLPIGDLTVSLQGRRVVLRSQRLDCEVIPRMTTAHNFNLLGLGVYRFLCALQGQDTEGVHWSWGALASAPFLPRVRFGRHVLAKARWALSAPELKRLADSTGGSKKATRPEAIRGLRQAAVRAAQALREARELPRFVVLADGDNELPIDFENELSIDSFVATVRNRDRVELTELYPGPNELCVTGPSGRHVHQILVPFVRKREPEARPTASLPPRGSDRLPPGSPWLYAKIYTGTTTADDVLRDAVWPIAQKALAAGDAESWFFLRYADPETHLRVRFRGEPDRLRAAVLPALEEATAALMDAGHVWRLQIDTYERETSRYGGAAGIDLAEEWFWADSEAVCEIVDLLDGDDGEVARWQLALRGIDMLLDDLGLELEAKRSLLGRLRDGFASEFRADTRLRRELGKRFRAHAETLAPILLRDPVTDAAHDFEPGFAALEKRSQRQRDIAARLAERRDALTLSLPELAASFIHMHVNRLLRSAQRANEVVLYDFLKRHYDRLAATRKRSTGGRSTGGRSTGGSTSS